MSKISIKKNTQDNCVSTTQLLLSKVEVALLLGVSERAIDRLRDRGAMPRVIKLGGLCKWRASDITQWVSEGCPKVRRS